ncbi:MAG: hypothetical protein AB7L13_24635 [Acidimicrobiia bacterium]
MLFVSRFSIAAPRYAEWLACLWQGPAPRGITLRSYFHLGGEPKRMVVIWDAADDAAAAEMTALFAEFGEFTSDAASDTTSGLAACLARDLDAFAAVLRSRGTDEAIVQRDIDLRRRGFEAPSRQAAIDEAHRWEAEVSPD